MKLITPRSKCFLHGSTQLGFLVCVGKLRSQCPLGRPVRDHHCLFSYHCLFSAIATVDADAPLFILCVCINEKCWRNDTTFSHSKEIYFLTFGLLLIYQGKLVDNVWGAKTKISYHILVSLNYVAWIVLYIDLYSLMNPTITCPAPRNNELPAPQPRPQPMSWTLWVY